MRVCSACDMRGKMVTKLMPLLALFAVCAALAGTAEAGQPPAAPRVIRYLITNDDRPPKVATSGTVFTIAAGGTLQEPDFAGYVQCPLLEWPRAIPQH